MAIIALGWSLNSDQQAFIYFSSSLRFASSPVKARSSPSHPRSSCLGFYRCSSSSQSITVSTKPAPVTLRNPTSFPISSAQYVPPHPGVWISGQWRGHPDVLGQYAELVDVLAVCDLLPNSLDWGCSRGTSLLFREDDTSLHVVRFIVVFSSGKETSGLLLFRSYSPLLASVRYSSFLLCSTLPLLNLVILSCSSVAHCVNIWWIGSQTSAHLATTKRFPLLGAALPLYLAQNILTTGLIVYRIWTQHRRTKESGIVGLNTANLLSVIRVVVESAAVYTVVLLLMAVLRAMDHPGRFIVQYAHVPIAGEWLRL
jgi:hypothetical protein